VARIAGINIPLTKHIVIALTSIYGIGDRTNVDLRYREHARQADLCCGER